MTRGVVCRSLSRKSFAVSAAALAVGILGAGDCGPSGSGGGSGQLPSDSIADSVNTAAFMAHLRRNFDDIHDVSMRFHHLDHTIGGLVAIEMIWEDETLVSAVPGVNETGNPDLALALIDKLRGWRIAGLTGRFETTLPLRIMLVGSDDPAFPTMGILTGRVVDASGAPIPGASLVLRPLGGLADTIIRVRTNREGVFVRTLIPPGEWTLTCTTEGKTPVTIESIHLSAGDHHRESIVIR